jgi:hypothetical protein
VSRTSLHGGGNNSRYRYIFRGGHPPTTADCFDVGSIAIDVFPDDVLVEIFDFFLELCEGYEGERNAKLGDAGTRVPTVTGGDTSCLRRHVAQACDSSAQPERA